MGLLRGGPILLDSSHGKVLTMPIMAVSSLLGLWTLLISAPARHSSGAVGQVSFLPDSWMDVLVVGAIVVFGVGLSALAYRMQSTS